MEDAFCTDGGRNGRDSPSDQQSGRECSSPGNFGENYAGCIGSIRTRSIIGSGAVAGTAVPTTTPTYTLAQLQGVIGPLLSAGKGPELQSLLAKYGVAQMTDLRADQMDLFAADLRAMGAQI